MRFLVSFRKDEIRGSDTLSYYFKNFLFWSLLIKLKLNFMFTYFKCRSMTISKVYHQCLNELSYKIVGTYLTPCIFSLWIPKIKILKSWQTQVKVELEWNCLFQFVSYKQCYHNVYKIIWITEIKHVYHY